MFLFRYEIIATQVLGDIQSLIQPGTALQFHCRAEPFLKAGQHALTPFLQSITKVIAVADKLLQRVVLSLKVFDMIKAARCLQQYRMVQLVTKTSSPYANAVSTIWETQSSCNVPLSRMDFSGSGYAKF
jgi:hypothetical protein